MNEKICKAKRGMPVLILNTLAYILSVGLFIYGINIIKNANVSHPVPIGGNTITTYHHLNSVIGNIFIVATSVFGVLGGCFLSDFGFYNLKKLWFSHCSGNILER